MKTINQMMKQTKGVAYCLGTVVLLLTAAINNNSRGNAVAISALAVNQTGATGGTITFSITWDNSWRDLVNPPYNWDAVWVFVKFRACASGPTVAFTHGTINTTLANHNFDVNTNGAQVEPTTRDGLTIPGIDAATNNTGLMLRRTSDGIGTVTEQITITVDNLPDNTIPIDTRVFAAEMVYVTGGAVGGFHYVGDGSGASSSTGSITTGGGNNTAVTIPNENAITVYCNSVFGGPARALTASFPKGYNPFYVMKYEITQGQYTDFLNTLSSAQGVTRYPGSAGVNRHTITNTGVAPQVYTCTRNDRACNVLSWADESAYLDWAALRPLTEMEYEKAGRGFLGKTLNEYAWATITPTYPAAAGISGAENGTETITTANANVCCNNVNFTSGDNGQGPLRVGIFAKATTTTRLQTGASYFGVMEMTGNVEEYYIGIYAGIAGQVSNAGVLLGDGSLTAAGEHNVASWPAYNVTAGAVTATVIRRGGAWNVIRYLSYRDYLSSVSRDANSGGRGGR
ncbi:MAG: SUMF1/EgtB/PvdO family nonheme iron enzyme [Bacteroidetes bacterium]|nr:SUMF1/EgtB/PvdO family nonheme iron enzyme [Bacteroidota bacterium]